jgi:glycosyltransferase involved in cell wall biosynthesis
MKVVFFHRKPRESGNYSIESLFEFVRGALPREVQWTKKVMSYVSKGFFKRIYSCLEAAFNQEEINHITGDINFIAIFLRKSRTVLTIHDVGFMYHPSSIARFILKTFWIAIPVRRSARITVVSQATKKELLKFVNNDPAKIVVIYVPISPLFVPRPRSFNKEKPTILQIGTKNNKNLSRLALALRGINCRLQIIGTLDERTSRDLQAAGIEYAYAFNLTEEEMVSMYEASDLVSFVSTYEGFGMPIVEANAIGRPVVTSNVSSMPEVAGDAAHLVDPFDVNSIRAGILKVIGDDQYRERLITNGFRNKARYDVNSIAQQYADVYRQLANRVT